MVSIIIVTMGHDELLDQCLSSLKTHVRCAYEIILVNNAPDALLPDNDVSVTIIENGRNLGFARAVNRGLIRAKGDVVLLLNSDAVLSSDCITPMENFLSENPRCMICGPQLVFPDGRLQNSVDVIPNLFTQVVNKSLLKILFPRLYPSKRSGFTRSVEVPSVIGACMMIKRQLFDLIGMLDEGFFFYLEETDLCKRARDRGFEVWHLPHLSVVHHQGVTAKKANLRRNVEFHRSLFRFFRKHKGSCQYFALYGLTIAKLFFESLGHLFMAYNPAFKDRLRKSCSLLLWHLLGQPRSWGMEPCPRKHGFHFANRYTWYLKPKTSIPAEVHDPDRFMETFSTTVVNRSKTSLVKCGQLGAETIFLKRYNYKGIRDSLKNLFRKSRARRAFEASLMLEELGIATPDVLFSCEKRFCGVLLSSYLATRYVHAPDLATYLKDTSCVGTSLPRIAQFVRGIHEMGIVHTDFKAENLLIGDDQIYLIDLDRLHRVRYPSLYLIAKNLSYLNVSLERVLPEEIRCSFLQLYLSGNTSLEARRKELISRITAYSNKRRLKRGTP